MTDNKKKIERTKDKVAGKIKETTGKVTGNEQLELKGKIQSTKSDFKKKVDVSENIEEIKENVAGKINKNLDKKQAKKKKKKNK